jgi:prepilin-type N-terminal cleavage/methylation domain-containing protein
LRPTNDIVFKNRGFTLLEVIVIITILGILAGIEVLSAVGLKE